MLDVFSICYLARFLILGSVIIATITTAAIFTFAGCIIITYAFLSAITSRSSILIYNFRRLILHLLNSIFVTDRQARE